MKKQKNLLISSLLFLSYDIYVLISYIWFLFNKEKYGNVYYDILIYPHYVFMIIGTVLNFMAYFKNKKWMFLTAIICYILAIIFLFI